MKAPSSEPVRTVCSMNKSYQLIILTVSFILFIYLFFNKSPASFPIVPYNTGGNGTDCPVKNFVFVKTHKTGSSTMSNILLRYTENHRLNQLMGRYPTGTEYRDLQKKKFGSPPTGETYNAFIMHADYDYQFLSSMLPSDTKFFTFVRHPVSRYLSGFRFFGLNKKYDKTDFDSAVNMHLKANKHYLVNTVDCENCKHVVNSVATDLGFKFGRYVKSADKSTVMHDFLSNLDEEMDIVLMSEYYDLSLVLLARRFCWSFDDICYLKSLESTDKPYVSDGTMAKILQFQSVDAEIYQHYNETFWEIVHKEKGILEDTEKFKIHNEKMKRKCVAGKKVGSFSTWQYDLTEIGKNDFQCRAMSSRVLPFAHLVEKRNQGLRNDGPHQSDMLTLKDVYKICQ